MKCPHCQTSFHSSIGNNPLTSDEENLWRTETQKCPTCLKVIVELVKYNWTTDELGKNVRGNEIARHFIIPKSANRPNPSKDVPEQFAVDYKQASLVLADSPMASAALSRRCLQHLIREVTGIKERDLATEIQKLIDSKTLPSHLSESIDAIRNIGNFAAHPIKSTSSGEILDVELGEAEWNLDVLDGLFDFYFVQPTLSKAKKAALDAKLASAGKPPVK